MCYMPDLGRGRGAHPKDHPKMVYSFAGGNGVNHMGRERPNGHTLRSWDPMFQGGRPDMFWNEAGPINPKHKPHTIPTFAMFHGTYSPEQP